MIFTKKKYGQINNCKKDHSLPEAKGCNPGDAFGNVLLPFIFWMLKKEEVNGINKHGKDILNAQLTYSIVAGAFFASWVSLAMMPLFAIPSPIIKNITFLSYGLLASKPAELLQDRIWYTFFYLHILCGAVSLLTGWSQFSKRIRIKN